MSTILALIRALLFGLAGWFIYRCPILILDFVFGKDPGQWRPIRFLKVFGIVMIALACLGAAMIVVGGFLKM